MSKRPEPIWQKYTDIMQTYSQILSQINLNTCLFDFEKDQNLRLIFRFTSLLDTFKFYFLNKSWARNFVGFQLHLAYDYPVENVEYWQFTNENRVLRLMKDTITKLLKQFENVQQIEFRSCTYQLSTMYVRTLLSTMKSNNL